MDHSRFSKLKGEVCHSGRQVRALGLHKNGSGVQVFYLSMFLLVHIPVFLPRVKEIVQCMEKAVVLHIFCCDVV